MIASHPLANGAGNGAAHDVWTCPFCSLLCDDLQAFDDGEYLTLRSGDCPRAARALSAFSAHDGETRALVDGKTASLDSALDAAAEVLRESRQPLFGGLATDVAGMRNLHALADRCGAILDHAHGDVLLHSLRALQDRGGIATTLAEIRNRADLIVCIGTQPGETHPRFFHRCTLPTPDAPPVRGAVFLDTPIDPAANGVPGLLCSSVTGGRDMFETLAQLNLLCGPLGENAAATAPAALVELAGRLKSAHYAVIVWSAQALAMGAQGGHAALLIERIHQLLRTLNRTTRAGGFALTPSDGADTANQVVTWLSGLPLRTRLHRDGLVHDPHRYATARLLRTRAVDALLWVTSFTPTLTPPAADLPLVMLGHPASADALRKRCRVFIPVATPGIDTGGHLCRCDGVVVLPLRPVHSARLPAVSTIAHELLQRIDATSGEVSQ